MTELFINRESVVLPDSFSNSTIEENPIFTKRGKYSLDIDLSLAEPRNARTFKHINRFNATIESGEMSAVLISDNQVVLSGSCVILSINQVSVKIQLVSGNSEFNFIASKETSIRDLDIGSVSYINIKTTHPDKIYFNESDAPGNQEEIYGYMQIGYPDKNFNLCAFYADDQDVVLNKFEYLPYYPGGFYNYSFPRYGNIGKCRPQPYLAAIIDKLVVALGYTLTENCIADHSIFKYYYIPHGYYTLEYAKMLPNWSISDFLTNVETFFNCTFVANDEDKTIRLIFNEDAIESTETEIEVFDDYNNDIEPKNNTSMSKSNLSYNLDSNDYSKFSKLEENVYDFALKGSYGSLGSLYAQVDSDSNRFKKIYQGAFGDYIVVATSPTEYELKRVNQYKNFYQNQTKEINQEFDILPVAMKPVIENVLYDGGENPNIEYPFYSQLPVLFKTELTPAEATDDYNMLEVINGALNKQDKSAESKMYLARYNGLKTLHYVNIVPDFDVHDFPISYVDALAVYFNGKQTPRAFDSIDSFDLEWLADNLYTDLDIDTTKKFVMKFMRPGKLNILSTFVTRNKKFVCIKLIQDSDIRGIKKEMQGEFYPLN
jgi:hypothetical protein